MQLIGPMQIFVISIMLLNASRTQPIWEQGNEPSCAINYDDCNDYTTPICAMNTADMCFNYFESFCQMQNEACKQQKVFTQRNESVCTYQLAMCKKDNSMPIDEGKNRDMGKKFLWSWLSDQISSYGKWFAESIS